MWLWILLICLFSSLAILYYLFIPRIFKRYETVQEERVRTAGVQLENMFVWVAYHKLYLAFGLSPAILGVIFFLIFGHRIFILIGVVMGFILPVTVITQLERARKRKFQAQLVDALTSLSQSLKAGLSFLQAIEVLVEEMPPPISQEFGLLLKENKMGISFEDSFERMNKKMGIEEFNFMTTAILVARETGGNLTNLFSHLSDTIRQKKKISDQVKTLTVQARLQGIIMTALPVVFAIFVYKVNPDFFDIMLQNETGKMLLIWCVVSWAIGAVMLRHLGRVEV